MTSRSVFLVLFVSLTLTPQLSAAHSAASGREDSCDNVKKAEDKRWRRQHPFPPSASSQRYFHSTSRPSDGLWEGDNPLGDRDKFKEWLRCLDACDEISESCSLGDSILYAVYGIRRHELPNVIVYLEANSSDGPADSTAFDASRPSLLWRGRNTPFVRGADHLWVLVFADRKPDFDLEVHLLTLFEKSENPFVGLLALLEVAPATGEPKPAISPERKISAWKALTFESGKPLFMGSARLPVASDSVNLLSLVPAPASATKSEVSLASSPLPDDGELTLLVRRDASTPWSEQREQAAREVVGESIKPEEEFHLVSGHFSNSGASRVAFSVGLIGTFNAENTGLGETHFNGYALAKLYLFRPRIKAFLEEGRVGLRSRASLGLVVGTNVDDLFNELVLGVSIGHSFGRTGIVLGANRIPSLDHLDRNWRPFFGFEYTF